MQIGRTLFSVGRARGKGHTRNSSGSSRGWRWRQGAGSRGGFATHDARFAWWVLALAIRNDRTDRVLRGAGLGRSTIEDWTWKARTWPSAATCS